MLSSRGELPGPLDRLMRDQFRSGDGRRTAFIAVLLGAVSLVAGVVAASVEPRAAGQFLIVSIALGLISLRPVNLAIMAFAATFIVRRLTPAISYTDVVVAAAACLALPALARTVHWRRVSGILVGAAFYLATLFASVAAHPSSAAAAEWVHRLILIVGALAVGAWLAQENAVSQAMRWFVVVAVVFSALAIIESVRTGFQPAYPLGFHKNFVGGALALVILLVLSAPRILNIGALWPIFLVLFLVLGVLATQSRGAMLGGSLGVLIWFFRSFRDRSSKAWAFGLIVGIAFSVFAAVSVQRQLNDVQTVNNSSVGVRLEVEARARELWRSSPLNGVGIRYFNSGLYGPAAQAPNNAIDNELAESGVMGTIGFILFHALVITRLYRIKDQLGTAALAVFAGRLLHGMVDIYWSAGLTSMTFILVGVAVARHDWRSRG